MKYSYNMINNMKTVFYFGVLVPEIRISTYTVITIYVQNY